MPERLPSGDPGTVRPFHPAAAPGRRAPSGQLAPRRRRSFPGNHHFAGLYSNVEKCAPSSDVLIEPLVTIAGTAVGVTSKSTLQTRVAARERNDQVRRTTGRDLHTRRLLPADPRDHRLRLREEPRVTLEADLQPPAVAPEARGEA
jgi:hypothetical protein